MHAPPAARTPGPAAAGTLRPAALAERGGVGLLAMLIAFQPMSTDLYLPAMPALAEAFDAPAASVQATLSIYIAAFAFAQLLAGPLSDRFGRRPVAIGGVLAYVAGSLLAALAGGLGTLVAGRVLQAVGTCCTVVCARAIVRDRYDAATGARRLSQAASWVGLMPLAAPLLGGALVAPFGWRATFVVMTLFGLVTLIACLRLLDESNRQPDRRALRPGPMLANYLAVLRSPTWIAFTLIGTAMYWGLFAFLAESSFVFVGLFGLSPTAFGVAFAMVTTGFVLGTFAVRRVLPRIGIRRTLLAATVLSSTAGVAMLVLALSGAQHVAAVMAPQFVFVFAHGLSQAAWQAGSVAPFPRTAGAAAALTGFVQNVAAAGGGWLVGRLHDGSTLPMATMVSTAGIGGLLVALTLVRRYGGVDGAAR
jgi:DHA1 family bicyclomycin/chloramphenicol resistance-like MFS transporter